MPHIFGLVVPYDKQSRYRDVRRDDYFECVSATAITTEALNGEFLEFDVDHDRCAIAVNTPTLRSIDFVNGHAGLYLNVRLPATAWRRVASYRDQWNGLSIAFQRADARYEHGHRPPFVKQLVY